MLQFVDDEADSVSFEVKSTSSLPHISRYRIATPDEDDLENVAVIDICSSPPSSPDAEVPAESMWTDRATIVPETIDNELPETARLTLNDDEDDYYIDEDETTTINGGLNASIESRTILDSQRSVTLPSMSGRESYYDYEDDLGFVEGEDVSDRHQRSVTFLDQDDAQDRRQRHEDHYEKERMKYKEKRDKMESMSKVNTRRQKFHRSFNFVRARYPGSQTPSIKGPKLPASLCPPTRYGKEARVAETRDRTKKKSTWSSPPTYTAKQKYKDVACDCQIMRFAEKSDLAIQCTPYRQDVAIQCPLSMRTTATQYPRCRVKDHAVQMSGFGKVDAAVQNANSTRNVMVETCYKMTYAPKFTASEDIGVQCDETSARRSQLMVKQQSADLGYHKVTDDIAKTPRRSSLPESTQAGSPINSPDDRFDHSLHQYDHRSYASEEDSKYSKDFKESKGTALRIIRSNNDDGQSAEIVGLGDDEYSSDSSDWDSGDELSQEMNSFENKNRISSIGPTSSHVSIAIREDAHS